MGKLALIFLAFVFVIAGVTAHAADTPPLKDSGGVQAKPCPPKVPGAEEGFKYPVGCPDAKKSLPTKKEAPKKSAPPAPAGTAKALDPTKKAAPDPSELAEKAGQ